MRLAYKNVFVAGAAGLAGTHILQTLLKHDTRLRIRGTFFKHTRPIIQSRRIEYVRCDLTSAAQCRKAVRGCDAAIMAAAFTGGARFVREHPAQHALRNLLMNLTMLRCFAAERVRKIILIGSATLYQPSRRPLKETDLALKRDPPEAYYGFGWVGRYLEAAARLLHERTGASVLVARCANLYGPYSKFDPKTSNFIPALIRKAVAREDPFEIWGSPGVTRDVLFAEDFAEAVWKMLCYQGTAFDVFNLGSGQKTTVEQVARLALEYSGHHPDLIRYLAGRPATMRSLVLDCDKARLLLGWTPRRSLKTGIAETLRWWSINQTGWKR